MSGSARLVLFRCLLLPLRESEALRLLAACLAFPNVVSALAVSHTAQHSPFRRRFKAISLPPMLKTEPVESGESSNFRGDDVGVGRLALSSSDLSLVFGGGSAAPRAMLSNSGRQPGIS